MNDQTIRLIALDLDGTLLNSAKELTPRNRAALEAAAARSVHVVPATGRFFGGIPEEVRSLPGTRYAITINGACVYDTVEERSVYDAVFPLSQALAVLEFLDGYPVIYDCYQGNAGWMPEAMYRDAEQYIEQPPVVEMVKRLRQPVPNLKEMLIRKGEPVQKLQLFTRDQNLRWKLYEELGNRFPDLSITTALPNNVEINSREANKGEALKALLNHLEITQDECIAFGDGLNDVPMLREAGVGVAMANGYPEAKAAADLLAEDCDSDGVAKVLEDLLG